MERIIEEKGQHSCVKQRFCSLKRLSLCYSHSLQQSIKRLSKHGTLHLIWERCHTILRLQEHQLWFCCINRLPRSRGLHCRQRVPIPSSPQVFHIRVWIQSSCEASPVVDYELGEWNVMSISFRVAKSAEADRQLPSVTFEVLEFRVAVRRESVIGAPQTPVVS